MVTISSEMISERLGGQLRNARKKRFPSDNLKVFALRISVSRATLQKMEKGDMSVGIGKYYAAAQVLGVGDGFGTLFTLQESLFDD